MGIPFRKPTNAAPRRRPRVLIVGAYERDNFGDLLFLLVTEPFLRDAEVFATAPFAADMTDLLGREVHAYGPMLRDERFDVIWTAGGQVGRISLHSAYRHSAPRSAYAEIAGLQPDERDRALIDLVGGDVVSPYLPSPLAFPRNAGTIMVANSVGFGGIELVEPDRMRELIPLLRGLDLISVRDQETSRFLARRDIPHRVVPDVVHAISQLHPHTRAPAAATTVVQASGKDLARHGHAELAAALLASAHLRGRPIRFVPAGLATGHDTIGDYERVIEHLRERDPDVDAAVVDDRDPLRLVEHIRSARLVIATSLHMRIVACSYAVPRVSLVRPKAAKYARKWDSSMPFNARFDQIPQAVEHALAIAEDPLHEARSTELSKLAYDNIADLSHRVLRMACAESDEARTERERLRRRCRADHPAAEQGKPPDGIAEPGEPNRPAVRHAVRLPRRVLGGVRRRARTLWWSRTHLRLAARVIRAARANRRGRRRWDADG